MILLPMSGAKGVQDSRVHWFKCLFFNDFIKDSKILLTSLIARRVSPEKSVFAGGIKKPFQNPIQGFETASLVNPLIETKNIRSLSGSASRIRNRRFYIFRPSPNQINFNIRFRSRSVFVSDCRHFWLN